MAKTRSAWRALRPGWLMGMRVRETTRSQTAELQRGKRKRKRSQSQRNSRPHQGTFSKEAEACRGRSDVAASLTSLYSAISTLSRAALDITITMRSYICHAFLLALKDILNPFHFRVVASARDRLVGPGADSDVGLASARCMRNDTYGNARGTHGVDGLVAVPDGLHHGVPGALEVRAIAAAGQYLWIQQSLTVAFTVSRVHSI